LAPDIIRHGNQDQYVLPDTAGNGRFCVSATRENGANPPLVAPILRPVPSKVWREVGPLDETFQIGMFEDDDFSFRVRKAGYGIVPRRLFIHHSDMVPSAAG
jgi:GT2 family glycosyltransferase